jgi:hypothetical protein
MKEDLSLARADGADGALLVPDARFAGPNVKRTPLFWAKRSSVDIVSLYCLFMNEIQ